MECVNGLGVLFRQNKQIVSRTFMRAIFYILSIKTNNPSIEGKTKNQQLARPFRYINSSFAAILLPGYNLWFIL